MRTRSTLVLALALVTGGCGGVSYVGDVHPPTAHLDVFFVDGAVEQSFTTIGTLEIGTAETLAELEMRLASAGMQRGADAVLIDGLSATDAGSVASHRADGNGRPRYIQDLATGGVRNVGGAEHHERLAAPTAAMVTARLLMYDR